MTDEPDEQVDSRIEYPHAGLEWYAFLSRYFPYRRRHDHQALKAYEAYRSKETLGVLAGVQQHLVGGADLFTSWVTTAAPANPLPDRGETEVRHEPERSRLVEASTGNSDRALRETGRESSIEVGRAGFATS
jgi:hypothetical protein